MNRTEMRQLMLSLVSTEDVYKHIHDICKQVWKFKVATDQGLPPSAFRALGDLQRAGLVREVVKARLFAPRLVVLTSRGKAVLSEWNDKHRPVSHG